MTETIGRDEERMGALGGDQALDEQAGTDATLSKEEEQALIRETLEDVQRATTEEADNREWAKEADRFLLGDHWTDEAKKAREGRPQLTVPLLGKFTRQVVNDSRQNRPQIKAVGVDDQADPETAEMITGLLRDILYVSRADMVQDWALEQAVDAGWGYMRVVTKYLNDDSNDQELRVLMVRNRFSVYLDPDAILPDGSDAKWAVITSWVPREAVEEEGRGGDYDERTSTWPWANTSDRAMWEDKKMLRVAERYYFGPPEMITVQGRRRPSVKRKLMYCRLTARGVIEGPREMKGQYVPVVRVWGNAKDEEGRLRLFGMVHDAMDIQRFVDYEISDVVERTALYPRVPIFLYEGQEEGHEEELKAVASGEPRAYLTFKPTATDDGQVLPLPQINPFPQVPAGNLALLAEGRQTLSEITGMFPESLGKQSNAESGRAILGRQREGDTSTFHYADNLHYALQHLGTILVDLIPHVYDTERTVRILGETGDEDFVEIRPGLKGAGEEGEQPQSYREMEYEDPKTGRKGRKKLFDPSVGRYDVRIVTGPSYATKRQEQAEGMMNMLPALQPDAGAYVPEFARALDWPGAEDIAAIGEAIREMKYPVLAQIKLEEGEDPVRSARQARAMVAQLQPMVQQLQAQLQQAQMELKDKSADRQLQLVLAQIKAQVAAQDQYLKLLSNIVEAEGSLDVEKLRADVKVVVEQLRSAQRDVGQALSAAVRQPVLGDDQGGMMRRAADTAGQLMGGANQQFQQAPQQGQIMGPDYGTSGERE